MGECLREGFGLIVILDGLPRQRDVDVGYVGAADVDLYALIEVFDDCVNFAGYCAHLGSSPSACLTVSG